MKGVEGHKTVIQKEGSKIIIGHALFGKWLKTALVFFLLASVLGTTMRLMFVVEIKWLDYKHILHAHSHTAMLGWIFMLLSGCLIFCLKPIGNLQPYRRVYWLSLIAATGMFVSFIIQGYGIASISFSTLHVLISYYFGWLFLRQSRLQPQTGSRLFFRWSVIWMMISTLGLWSLGIVSATASKLHPLFYASVQFFLHFQFNGWFTYAVIGLLLYHAALNGHEIRVPKISFVLLQISLIMTYALSITWSTPEDFLFLMNAVGVILQLLAFAFILIPLFRTFNLRQQTTSHWGRKLIYLGLVSLCFKILIQTLVVLPSVAVISYTIRNYVIAFIHLIMLGSITLIVSGLLISNQTWPWNTTTSLGWKILLSGFISTETLLFGQGTLLWMNLGFIPFYYTILLSLTLLLPTGITLILIGSLRTEKKPDSLQ